jgi:phenylalanyl-tRNA synthetase beta chain
VDLIEEVARVYGFENIPQRPPIAPNVMRIAPENERSTFRVRHQLADLDYQEVVNYSFVEEAWEADFAGNTNPVRLVNPIASQMSVMRSTLIGGLVANVQYNLNRRLNRVRVFETGAAFLRSQSTADGALSVAGYEQPKRVAALAYGPVADEQWGQATRNADFFDIKADLEALFAPKVLRFEKTEHAALHPGRSARVMLEGRPIGFVGELHPRWQQKYELPLAPVVFEVDVDALQTRDVPVYREIPRFQPVTRDLALVVKQTVLVQDMLDVFQSEKLANPVSNILQAVVLFDEYRGKGLENDEKSLAFRFTLQDTHKTLQDDAVEAAMAAFVAVAGKRHGAKLRV